MADRLTPPLHALTVSQSPKPRQGGPPAPPPPTPPVTRGQRQTPPPPQRPSGLLTPPRPPAQPPPPPRGPAPSPIPPLSGGDSGKRLPPPSALQAFQPVAAFGHNHAAARGARLVHRAHPGGEVAGRIVRAAIKHAPTPAPRLALDDRAAALR